MEEVAEEWKEHLLNDPELRARQFERALPYSGRDTERLVLKARELLVEEIKGELGEKLAKKVANTLVAKHAVEFFRGKNTDKEEILREAFHTERGSLAAMLSRAKLRNRRITMDDVRAWRRENVNVEKRPKKFNSWVGNRAKEEYQVDLFFFEDLKPRAVGERSDGEEEDEELRPRPKRSRGPKLKEEINGGLLAVDTFSKRLAVVPIPNKTKQTIQSALEKAFKEMGGKPGMIFSDAEPALTSAEMQDWFSKERIAHTITLKHAPLAERMIGYIKTQIVRSMKPNDKWWQVVPEVVERYNKEHISRSTKMTPMQASQESNRQQVKTNLESIRKMDNNQPRLDAGDKVRVILKKKFEKGYAPNWSDRIFTVRERVEGNHAPVGDVVDKQIQYTIADPTGTLPTYKKKYMRDELLLVKKG